MPYNMRSPVDLLPAGACTAGRDPDGKAASPGTADFAHREGPLSESGGGLLKHKPEGIQSPRSPMAMSSTAGSPGPAGGDLESVLRARTKRRRPEISGRASDAPPDPSDSMNPARAAHVLQTLAQASRFAIFLSLVEAGPGGLSAGAIAKRLGIAAPTLSFHLARLKRAGIASCRRRDPFVYYYARFATVNALAEFLAERCGTYRSGPNAPGPPRDG